MHGDTPVYLQQVLNGQQVDQNNYILRNEHNIPQFRARTSTFLDSFFPKTIQDWNNLPNSVKEAGSLEIFISKLNADMVKVPKWYFCGNRDASIKHSKLRMLCSPLNDHLYSHIHVVDSPACPCGHTRENNKHYLLECNLFGVERNIMLQSLQQLGFQPSLNNLLYGNHEYSEECNIAAFGIVQNFLTATGRL